jgi:excisionase family DNA binding protein
MDNPKQPPLPFPKLCTFAEAAARASNSVAWWRKLAARRGIGVVKLGRSVRLRESDVERIVREGFRPPREIGR